MTGGVDVGTIIGIMGATFTLTTLVIGVLVRQLLRVYKEKTEEQIKGIKTEYNERLASVQTQITDISGDRKDCEDRESKLFTRLESQVDKLRDQWADFQKSDSTMEATRGRRLDALFNVVDHWKDEVRGIKPAIFQRLDQLHQRSADKLEYDLKKDLQEYIKNLVNSGT